MKSSVCFFLVICMVLMSFQGYAADINCVMTGQCDQDSNKDVQKNQQAVQDSKTTTDVNQQVVQDNQQATGTDGTTTPEKQRKCKKYAPPPSSSSSVLKDVGNTILDVFMVVTLPFAFLGGGGIGKLPTVKTSGNSAKDLMKIKQQRCLEWEDETPTQQTQTENK